MTQEVSSVQRMAGVVHVAIEHRMYDARVGLNPVAKIIVSFSGGLATSCQPNSGEQPREREARHGSGHPGHPGGSAARLHA
jgi:hypothetical protein